MIKKISLFISLSISVNASGAWMVKSVHDELIQKIFFVDEMNGWACANFPGVLKTEDGGNTWKKIYFGGNGSIYAIWFVTKDKGWAVGAHVEGGNYGDSGIRVHPVIFVTNDGGQSWYLQKIIEKHSGDFESLFFTDELHGWVSGGVSNRPNGILLYTNDGGENWMEFDSPAMRHDDDSGDNVFIRDIYFSDPQHGWAIGQDFGVIKPYNSVIKTKIFYTSDSGKSWSLQSTINNGSELSNIHFIDSMNGWVIGGRQKDGNAFLRTTNGGNTWTKMSMPPEEEDLWLSDAFFVDKMHGWACGDKGMLFITNDGGNSWIIESLPTEEYLKTIIATKSKIYIGGLDGNIYINPLSFEIK